MTVETTVSRAQYNTNGTTGPWSVLFPFLRDEDLQVIYTDSDGNETELVLNVGYTVTGAGGSSGSVTTTTAYASGGYVTILRDVDPLQADDYVDGEDFPANTVERGFDRLTMLAQQLLELAGRALVFAPSDTSGSTLPAATARANLLLGFDSDGRVALVAPTSGSASDLALQLLNTSDVTKGDALIGVKRTATGAVTTTAHDWIERQQLDTFADFGLNPDGTTDRTSAINTITAALGVSGFRGALRIPAGTKFNPTTVFAAVPTGVMLDITDSVNWGQPPGYRNRFKILYSGDTVSDDTQQVLASGHHPAMMLLNMGTAGSAAAAARFASLLHGVGRDADGDPLLGWLFQFAKSPSAAKWRCSWRLQTPYAVAIGNPTAWTTGQVVAAGAYRTSDGGKVYKTTAGGTCGGVAPTGTGTAINDGGVLWDYVQAAINIDSTRMDLDEDGNAGFYGPTTVRVTLTGGAQTAYFEVNSTTGDVTLRDDLRSTDLWRSSTTNGVRSGRIQSFNRVNSTISATGAFQLVTGLHFLTASGGPWDITDLTLPTGQTSGEVTLWFAGTNLTIKNNANIVTRTGADIASAANMMVTLYKDVAVSSSWVVKSKN